MKRISVSLTTLLATLAVSGFSHAAQMVSGKITTVQYSSETTVMTIWNSRARTGYSNMVNFDIVDGKTPQTIKDTLLHPELLGKNVSVLLEDHVVASETRKVVVGLVRRARF